MKKETKPKQKTQKGDFKPVCGGVCKAIAAPDEGREAEKAAHRSGPVPSKGANEAPRWGSSRHDDDKAADIREQRGNEDKEFWQTGSKTDHLWERAGKNSADRLARLPGRGDS